jgi:hypothetical protein
LLFPLTKPDVPVSGIRLSGWLGGVGVTKIPMVPGAGIEPAINDTKDLARQAFPQAFPPPEKGNVEGSHDFANYRRRFLVDPWL